MKFCLFISFFVINTVFTSALKWTDCGRNDRKIMFERIDITPVPLSIRSKMIANIKIRTKQIMDNSVSVSLRISRQAKILWSTMNIPVPCVSELGSCEYKFCRFVRIMNGTICPVMQSIGKDCDCPIEADEFITYDTPVRLAIKPIPSLIAAIGNGVYNLKALITDYSGAELGCLNVETEIDMSS